MAAPVNKDNLTSGCAKYLLSIPEIVDLVGSDAHGPRIWQYVPLDNMERTAETGIVVMRPTSWSGSDEAHTYHSMRLGLEFWTGPIRDALGNVIEPAETQRRMDAVYDVVDNYMHRPGLKEVWWGEVRTYSCERIGDINQYSVGPSDEVSIGQVFYGVQFN